MKLIFECIGNMLDSLDYAVPIVAMFFYRLFVLILLYSITKQLNEIISILTSK